MDDRVEVGAVDGLQDDVLAAYESLTREQRDALMMELARRRAPRAHIPRLDRSGGPPRASSAQERLWFLEQLEPDSVAYVMPIGVRLHGALSAGALGRALDEIVRRHETLRTTFKEIDGRPYQVIADPAPVPLPVTDLRELPPAERETAVHSRRLEEVGRPFDLSADPGLRARLLRVADDEHILLLSMHHIVSDGWSLGVVLRELAAFYEAFEWGGQALLAEPPVQYADFAAWQHERIARILDWQLGYWRDRLAGAPMLELPADRPRPAVFTSAGAAVPLRLPPELMARVGRLAEAAQATPFMVLQAAFAVLLWRWSGQDDLLIGYPVAGRVHPDVEPLVGFFVNTLPLRADLSGAPTFTELVAQVRADLTAAYDHQEVPFEQIVREVHPDRSSGPVPLIQVMLALRDVPMPQMRMGGLDLEPLDQLTLSTKFDLCLDLVPDGAGGIDGRAEYRTSLFDEDTIRRLTHIFPYLIEGLVDAPDAPVAAAPMMAPAAAGRLVAELCGDGSGRTRGTLHGPFEDHADAAPDAPAVLCEDRTLSYGELEERANRLAWYLRGRGVGPEEVVGVCLPRSEQMVVALLALLKAGAAYVPLDPDYPRRRVGFMVADSRVRLVLTDAATAESGVLEPENGAGPELIRLDEVAAEIAAAPARRPDPIATERNLAYVIYTSGSTGVPKGAMNEHGGLAGTLRGMNRVYGLGPDDRMLVISSLNYDMSVYEIFGALAAGAAVVVPAGIEITDPAQLMDLVVGQGVTAWSSAPALLDMLVNYAYERDGMPGAALRVVGVGGDRMPPALPVRLHELVPGVRLFNLAGMTEVSYCTTSHLVVDTGAPRPVIPWGRPLPGHRVYVLDDRLRPTPVGIPGELFIGGAGPGRGYRHRPGLTACRFVADPYAAEPGGRMYATGDRARFLANGDLEYLGRLDHQLKIRGFRIEAGEVEAAIAAHPDVVEPVVMTYEEPGAGRALVAYLTTRGTAAPSTEELRRDLADRLPQHMIPARFVILDELPRLPSGKLDRSALPDPLSRPTALETAYIEPDGPLEQVLADLLADVLGIERVGALDDFFDLGGHSLLATQAVSRIRELFRTELPIPVFLGAGTVRDLAMELGEIGMRTGADVDAVAELVLQVSALSTQEAVERLAE